MTASSDNFPSPGDLFGGRYQIERIIGRGGFSRVYLATQTDLGRRVAMKIMRPSGPAKLDGSATDLSASGNLAERFLQEARVVARLSGPHTVTVHDHGRTDDGLLFMVLEYVNGISLAAMLKDGGPVAPSRVKRILEQALESLQEAHSIGLLHRDIKPGNIMVYEHLGRPDNVKVLDFGIAKIVGQEIDTSNCDDLTQSGSLLGTPRYMSPEQLRGQELTGATDIYSLGLVAFEMLMGKKAIDANSSVLIIGAQLDPRPFAVPNLPHIPPRLRMVVNRMLAKGTEERYATAGEVLVDLAQVDSGPMHIPQLPSRPSMFTPIDDLPDISDSIELLDVRPLERQVERETNARRFVPIAAAVGLLLVGAIVWFAARPSPVPELVPGEPIGTPEVRNDGANIPAQIAPPEPPRADAPTIREVIVSTIPMSAQIYVNGESRGQTPVTLVASDVKFPMKLRAVTRGGGERLMVVDSPVSLVEIDLSMFADKSQSGDQQAGRKEKNVTTASKRKPKTSPKTDPKPDPEPDPKPDAHSLVIPALDY